jgi:membrane protease YdiL (CAAX protease family)
MIGPSNVIRRWPLVSFFLLAYVLSWWIFPLQAGGFPVFPFGPDLAALIVVAVTVGRAGVRRVLISVVRWRAAPRWYAVALLLPPAITLASVLTMRWLGATPSELPGVTAFVSYLVILPVMLLIGGPLGEELGFRGYALPVLMQRHRPLIAVALLAAGHVLWHLPLFFGQDPPPFGAFVLGLFSGGVVSAWLFNSTRNIIVVMLLHAGFNTSQQQFMASFTAAHSGTVQLIAAVGWALAAVAVIGLTRGALVSPADLPPAVPLHDMAAGKETKGPLFHNAPDSSRC